MAIPAIAPYPMPAEHDLPEPRVRWTPDPRRAVLLVHDMQNYFLDAYAGDPLPALLKNIARLRAVAAATGVPVVYSAQPGAQTREQRGLLRDFWGDGIGPTARERGIVDELAPGEDDTVLTKWRYSAFVRTDLADLLLPAGRDQLIVTGVYAHIGCQTTAVEAFSRDVQPFFVADAVADFSAGHHRAALTYAAQRCATTTTTARLADALSGVAAGTA
ncbi:MULTISPECIES: isochorismatase family protein [Thermomonosporaceae]|uniref:isochorismatase family protein n=1 Tax=Thermomonosporaceae TaxID=2012 RepID=UPI00255ADACF|nr:MULTISPECIES: isochorismatase family protein [Thermomonosporaceae]MDL4770557.1 isochorismatase family protein [Actinomadura xylanilytica]